MDRPERSRGASLLALGLSKGSMDSGCSKKNYDNKCLDPFHNSDYRNIALTWYKCILSMM